MTSDKATEDRRAPVQGYVQGIPWEMHLRAYNAYCAIYSKQEALITGGCRGGFHTSELDTLIPGWRDELSERTALLAENVALRACLEQWDSAYYGGPVSSNALNDAAEAARKLLEGKSDAA